MDDPTEELIREIAAKHGIAVARDDPILVLQTINNRLLRDGARAQQEQLDRHKEELEALTVRWHHDAKGMAERILNASLAASRNTMEQVMEQGARESAAAMRSECDAALAHLDGPVHAARRIAILNIVASCITVVVAATIALWSALR